MGDLSQFVVRKSAHNQMLAPPTYINARKLAANTAVTINVPTNADLVVFVPKAKDAEFWVRWDGSAAAIPTGSVTDGSGSEPNPLYRCNLANIDSFSMISPTKNTIVSMLFYRDDSEAGDLNE